MDIGDTCIIEKSRGTEQRMRSKTQILLHQRRWAESIGLDVDQAGYLPSVSDNLRTALSESARNGFQRGSGSELRDSSKRRAKMRALHSSSALVANFFDYWTGKDSAILVRLLDLEKPIEMIAFEAQFPTGLGGNPPNLDVALNLIDGHVVGIESKFTEWLSPKTQGKKPFKEKYFPAKTKLWETKGLSNCQKLAESIQEGTSSFRYLDVAQLLKHALGLATQHGDRFSLMYMFYDAPGKEASSHREEIRRFDEAVGIELRLQVKTYQIVFDELSAEPEVDSAFVSYLRSRYFPEIE